MAIIPLDKVHEHTEVYTVEFYHGYIDGRQYEVVTHHRYSMNMNLIVGAVYYSNRDQAQAVADMMNKQ